MTESEETLNACSECFEKEALRLTQANTMLFKQAEELREKLVEWRSKYYRLEAGLPPPIPSDSEVVLASRRVGVEVAV